MHMKNKELTGENGVAVQSLAEEAGIIEREKEIKKEKRRKSRGLEILRFIVVGIVCTVLDFAIQYCLMKWAFHFLLEYESWGEYVAWGLSVTIAFLIATFVNFLFSRLWVYQNVDKRIKTNNAKTFFIYLGLGVGGWAIGLLIQECGVLLCNFLWPDLSLSLNFVEVSFAELFTIGGVSFWAFVAIFVVKTCVTMIYNYLTRKHIIFKEPKELPPYNVPSTDAPLVVTAAENEPDVPHLVTRSSFKKIFHEETEAVLGDPYKIVHTSQARKIIREELTEYESHHV